MHVELARSPRHRRNLRIGAAVAAVVAMAALVIGLAGLGAARSWVGRTTMVVVGVALAALALDLVRAAGARPGRLDLVDGNLVIEHPELLRSPIVVPRDQVRTVLVDVDPVQPIPGLAPEHAPRFPLVETGADPAWLHPGARLALPYLGAQRDAPDAVVVLRSALRLGRRPRRLLALLEGNEELRALATCAGLFLKVADPAEAAAAVHSAGLDAPLTLAEANRLEDMGTDRRLFGRER